MCVNEKLDNNKRTKEKKRNYCVTLQPSIQDQVKNIATLEKSNISVIIENYLKQYIAENKEKLKEGDTEKEIKKQICITLLPSIHKEASTIANKDNKSLSEIIEIGLLKYLEEKKL